jgi:FkbM family methyltransferase
LTGREDAEIVAFCREHLPPAGVAVDVGANVGFVSVPVGRFAAKTAGRVLAIEALPANTERLRRHIARAGLIDTVDVVGSAAGASPGTAVITVDREFGFTTNGVITDAPVGDNFERTSISVATLDGLCDERRIERIDVIKIDVEGFEPFVLQGAGDLLARGAVGRGVLEVNEPHLARNGWTRDRLFKLMKELGVQPYPLKAGGDIATDFNVAFVARE